MTREEKIQKIGELEFEELSMSSATSSASIFCSIGTGSLANTSSILLAEYGAVPIATSPRTISFILSSNC